MPSILVVCTANQFRSPLASGLLRKELAALYDTGEWYINSAGTWTENGRPLPGITRQLARQLGLEGIEYQVTHSVNRELLGAADLIIVMEANHKEALCFEFPEAASRIFMLTEIAEEKTYDIPDPASSNTNADEVVKELIRLITSGLPNIVQAARSLSKQRG